ALLEVVNDLFEEQTDLEKIVKKIMHRAQTLLKCERCSVLLLEDIESPAMIHGPLKVRRKQANEWRFSALSSWSPDKRIKPNGVASCSWAVLCSRFVLQRLPRSFTAAVDL
ncbi:hypothetical protein P7K49_013923, partial [Saguinus oedipus]